MKGSSTKMLMSDFLRENLPIDNQVQEDFLFCNLNLELY